MLRRNTALRVLKLILLFFLAVLAVLAAILIIKNSHTEKNYRRAKDPKTGRFINWSDSSDIQSGG